MISSEEIRKKFLDFFGKKGHKIIPSSSLIPDDPTSLFTSAGMQQLSLYLEGKKDVLKDFSTRHLVSCQKCFRTGDIEKVGNASHHTFFEMLGNWSIGEDRKTGYFKEGAIKYALEFFCKELGLEKNRIWVTVFKGEKNILRDKESFTIWQKNGIPKERIKEFGMEDNFWGPVSEVGPCGPCSEIHYDRGVKYGCGSPECGPNCLRCERFVELWNLVFMEYNKKQIVNRQSQIVKYEYEKLPQRNIDTGVGFERLVRILQNKDSDYQTDLFWPMIEEMKKRSPRNYLQQKKNFRIIADHLRGVCFLVTEGVLPSNVERGYVLRRLLRRIQRSANILELKENWEVEVVKSVIKKCQKIYPELTGKENDILIIIEKEKEKFDKALKNGMKYLEKLIEKKFKRNLPRIIKGEEAFFLYETYGFPLEMIQEIAKDNGFEVEKEGFQNAFQKHQEVSRKEAEKKFGGHGLVGKLSGEDERKITKLHTATHLLHQSLREVLGKEARQMGSDINPERLRFDFSFSRKMTEEEIKKVEDLVNQKIKEGLEVKMKEMPLKQALASGASALFCEKYPERVKVYSIDVFSREICGGPHVKNTRELGEFRIQKEESSGKGVRRIRAILK